MGFHSLIILLLVDLRAAWLSRAEGLFEECVELTHSLGRTWSLLYGEGVRPGRRLTGSSLGHDVDVGLCGANQFLPCVKSLAVSFDMVEQTGLEWWSMRFCIVDLGAGCGGGRWSDTTGRALLVDMRMTPKGPERLSLSRRGCD